MLFPLIPADHIDASVSTSSPLDSRVESTGGKEETEEAAEPGEEHVRLAPTEQIGDCGERGSSYPAISSSHSVAHPRDFCHSDIYSSLEGP